MINIETVVSRLVNDPDLTGVSSIQMFDSNQQL